LCILLTRVCVAQISCYALGVYYSKHFVKNPYTIVTHHVCSTDLVVVLYRTLTFLANCMHTFLPEINLQSILVVMGLGDLNLYLNTLQFSTTITSFTIIISKYRPIVSITGVNRREEWVAIVCSLCLPGSNRRQWWSCCTATRTQHRTSTEQCRCIGTYLAEASRDSVERSALYRWPAETTQFRLAVEHRQNAADNNHGSGSHPLIGCSAGSLLSTRSVKYYLYILTAWTAIRFRTNKINIQCKQFQWNKLH